jgi:beta-glucanase (GH16 family)
MKWDPVAGAWPAIWMLPVQEISGASETGELDIFEGQGSTPTTYYGTIHDWQNGTSVASNNNDAYNLGSGVDFTQYHTYGVLWVPGSVTWYFDNNPIITTPTYPIFDSQNYFLILGSQAGSILGGRGNMGGTSATSLSMSVQWVHVWQP